MGVALLERGIKPKQTEGQEHQPEKTYHQVNDNRHSAPPLTFLFHSFDQ